MCIQALYQQLCKNRFMTSKLRSKSSKKAEVGGGGWYDFQQLYYCNIHHFKIIVNVTVFHHTE